MNEINCKCELDEDNEVNAYIVASLLVLRPRAPRLNLTHAPPPPPTPQTYKLNAAAGKKISTFLGSGQNDYNEEVAARNGERLLIYITPEKLENWLDEIVSLHQNHGPLSCIAIDEVHCCSQWGHDFRPAFLRMDCIRKRPELANIPIVALTGTSTSKVKAVSLGLGGGGVY